MVDKHGGIIDRYRIVAPIGSGGFATVYRAVDERLGSEVALKVLAENHSLNPDYRERFISEAQHLRRVDSYWVASVFDLGETETGQPYMVLELADRGDLETRVNNLWDGSRGLERSDLLVLTETLAHSLAAIHAADLVHRDVTPGNLLVRHNGLRPEPWVGHSLLDRGERLLLSDLGYAKDLRAASGITSGGGTAGFAAPEQHGDLTQVDIRADIYGATAVLQWAAIGSDYEEQLAEIADIGMAEDPDDRFEDMGAWNAAIRAQLKTHYTASAAGGAGDVTELVHEQPEWTRQLVAGLAGISVGFIAAALMWFSRGDDDSTNEADATSTVPSLSISTTVAGVTTVSGEAQLPEGQNPATATTAATELPDGEGAIPSLPDDDKPTENESQAAGTARTTRGQALAGAIPAETPSSTGQSRDHRQSGSQGENPSSRTLELVSPVDGSQNISQPTITGLVAAPTGVSMVIVQIRSTDTNTFYDAQGEFFNPYPADNLVVVRGTTPDETQWSLDLPQNVLSPGNYQIEVRAFELSGSLIGTVESNFSIA